jgi:hypothetical protein
MYFLLKLMQTFLVLDIDGGLFSLVSLFPVGNKNHDWLRRIAEKKVCAPYIIKQESDSSVISSSNFKRSISQDFPRTKSTRFLSLYPYVTNIGKKTRLGFLLTGIQMFDARFYCARGVFVCVDSLCRYSPVFLKALEEIVSKKSLNGAYEHDCLIQSLLRNACVKC